MADDVTILEPSAAPTGFALSKSAAKEIGGKKFQRVVLTTEVAGAQTDVGSSNALPVSSDALGKIDDASAVPAGNGSIISLLKGMLAAFGKPSDPEFQDVASINGPVSIVSLLKAMASRARNPAIAAGEAFIGFVGGNAAVPEGILTRPNSTLAFTSGMLLAPSATASAVAGTEIQNVARKNGGSARTVRGRLTRSKNEGGTFRVHIFRSAPAFTSGDGGAFKMSAAAGYLGYIEITIDATIFASGARGFGSPAAGGSVITFVTNSDTKSLWYAIEARSSGNSDSGETFTFGLETDRD